MKYNIRKTLFVCLHLLLFAFFSPLSAYSGGNQGHELTIYIMPTLKPLDWVSPRELYKSTVSCFLKTIAKSDNYLLGHVAVKLETPLLDKPLLTAQTSCGMKEKFSLVFKQKVGLGMLGLAIQGRMEPSEELSRKLKIYAEREQLTFIRYKINEKAADRLIKFVKLYAMIRDNSLAPCNYYGGAFWPRYQDEGAGCSSFGIAMMELAGIKPVDPEKWIVNVKIPMKLVGGHLNNGKKVQVKEIMKTNSWYESNGTPDIDFISYNVYEPSLMFEWVENKIKQKSLGYEIIEEDGVAGLLIDATNAVIDENEPLFLKNKNPNLFINYHIQKIQNKIQLDTILNITQSLKIPEYLFLPAKIKNVDPSKIVF